MDTVTITYNSSLHDDPYYYHNGSFFEGVPIASNLDAIFTLGPEILGWSISLICYGIILAWMGSYYSHYRYDLRRLI